VRSTTLTTQLRVSRWHEQIADPTLADGIFDQELKNQHAETNVRLFYSNVLETPMPNDYLDCGRS
jgi:hypothetical protein